MMNQTKKHTTSKKLLALLLALIMTVSLLPMSVFAADVDVPETEQQVTEPVEEDMQEPEVTDAEDVADADVQNMEGGAAVYADAAQINYVEKKQSVPLKDGTFYRIVHIDCGRKYFSFDELKKIIDYAAASNYTHVELAFGNDGLRFLLDDMEVTASGVTYASSDVKPAIQAGNKDFYNAGTNELTQGEMDTIIAYAKTQGIGIIPMFDAPGHLQTVVRAMATLGVATNKYTTPTTSGTSVNYAIDFTDAASVNFVQALMQKYITYFKGQGCTMFNIAADECGFSSMTNTTYTAYAKMVNSMAAMVQNAGMTALAFNDGIYHIGLTTSVEFDTNIAVCYWDASSDKYAPAETLASKGFKIINTHNKWYYVIGASDTGWYGATWSKNNMNGTGASDCIANKCDVTDGGYQTKTGCMNAIWCDTPSKDANMATIEDHIKTLANVEYNKAYFTEVKAPEEVELPASDTKTNVSVVVKGQEGQTAAVKVEAKAARTEGLPASAEEAVSYEITPSVENTAYTGAGKVTLPVPAEWKDNTDRVRGYIVTNGKVETIQGSYDAATGKYTFDVLHFSEMGLILLAADSTEVTEERTITVTVGETVTDTIKDKNYAGSYTTEKPEIATVVSAEYKKVEGKQEFTPATSVSSGNEYYIKSGNTYLKLSSGTVTWVSDINSATKLTATSSGNGFKLRDASVTSNNYLRWRTNNSQWQGSNNSNATTLYFNESDQTLYRTVDYNRQWVNGSYQWVTTYSNPLGTPGTVTTTAAVDATTVTFKGVAEGTTYVTIGHVRYTINVIKENLDGVNPLPIQLWITNNGIQVDDVTTQTSGGFGNSRYAYYAQIQPAAAYGKNGAKLSDLIPASIVGVKEWGNVYWDKTAQNAGRVTTTSGTSSVSDFADRKAWTLDLLKGTLLSSGSYQTNLGTNRIESGTDFQYVRYYNKNWQVSADGTNWTTLSSYSVTTGSSSGSGTQIVAYYMMRTDVTKEVTTDVVDWGEETPKNTNGVILDYAVKYPNGTQVPSSFPVAGKTMYFNMLSSTDTVRRIYDIKALEESGYEVYMITVTPSSDSQSTKISMTAGSHPTYSYKGTEKVAWVDDEANLPAEFQSADKKYTSINSKITYTVGGEPTIKGVEIYSQQAMLVTYYLRPVVTLDSLHVHYIDKNSNNYEFYNYTINVVDPTKFDSNIDLDRTTTTSWKGNLVNGTVKNDQNQDQTVSADLSTMPAIGAKYKYANYTCVEVTHSDDLKHVYLYYEFTYGKTFVVDFGLPVVIKPSDLSTDLATANISNVIYGDTQYANVTLDRTNWYITYTLDKMISSADTITLTYQGTRPGATKQEEISFTLAMIPASTVYYEDSFAQFYDAGSTDAKKTFTETGDNDEMGKWYVAGTEQSAEQALEVLGEKKNVYGYDPAYATNNTTFSMGSAKKVTVNANTYKENGAWPTATFSFKGTGFDVISLTSNTSGTFFVTVTNKKTGEVVRKNTIDTYYGYHQDANGNWVAEANNPNTLYQIPVMKIKGLEYAEYDVEIKVAYASFLDHTNNGSYSFWLDAIRVYDPMGKDYDYTGSDNKSDNETNPGYVELRQVLVDANSLGTGGAVFIDGNANETSVATYANYGPNHEVYLAHDQAIGFKLIANQVPEGVQLAAKQLTGNTANLTVSGAKIGRYGETAGNTLELVSGTDVYYELSEINWTKVSGSDYYETNVITLMNSGESGIVALTNLKLVNAQYVGKRDDLANAADDEVLVTMAMSEEIAQEAVAAVDSVLHPQEVKTFAPERFEASWNRSSVKAGEKATLTVKTSEDVEAITVDGVTIDTYRTRTQRTGWGWNAKKVTYREFTYTITASETADHEVVAVNAEGTASEAIHAVLTVRAAAQRPGVGGWLNKLFSRWF